MSETYTAIGEISEWPGGYAMTLGISRFGHGYVRCCNGHPTPQEAKTHGLGRLVEVASEVADREIALWQQRESA